MRRYLLSLIALTAAVAVATLLLLPSLPVGATLLLAGYFCIVTALQHWIVTRSMLKDARRFVQIFLAVTVASLFLHTLLLVVCLLSLPEQARTFTLAFACTFPVYLVFETTALVLHIRREKRNREQ